MARGPAVAAGRRSGSPRGAQARVAREPPPRGARRRGAAAVRGRHGGRVRRDDRGRRRRGRPRASAPARAATRRVDERTARQLTQEEKAAASDVRGRRTPARSSDLEQTLSEVLEKLSEPMSARTATDPHRRPRAAPRRRAPRAARGGGSRCWRCCSALAARSRRARRSAAGRQGRAGDHAAAAPRGHHPPAGARQGPRPGADRRRHLHRVALPRPDLARRRQGPDAADARRPPTTSPASPAARAFEQGDLATPQINISYGSWYLRYLLDQVRRQRDRSRSPPTTRGRARSTSGGASAGRPRASSFGVADHIPFPETRDVRAAGAQRARATTATSTRASSASNVSAMNQRPLGRTGLQVSEIGYGAWGIGQSMWLGADDDESLQALNRADRPRRELHRHRPRLRRRAQRGARRRGWPRERDERSYVATKIPPKNLRWPAPDGIDPDDAFPADYIIACTERSLRNLGLDTRRRPAVPRLVGRVGRPGRLARRRSSS